jgi:hypothetical protein
MIPDLGTQLKAILEPRIAKVNEAVSGRIAEDINIRMKENTEDGRGFGNDIYINEYNAKYAARRGKKISPVTLRDQKKRIERYAVTTSKSGAVIELKEDRDMAIIFGYHHTGNARGRKVRSIFPKTVASVPEDIRDLAVQLTAEVLRGKVA